MRVIRPHRRIAARAPGGGMTGVLPASGCRHADLWGQPRMAGKARRRIWPICPPAARCFVRLCCHQVLRQGRSDQVAIGASVESVARRDWPNFGADRPNRHQQRAVSVAVRVAVCGLHPGGRRIPVPRKGTIGAAMRCGPGEKNGVDSPLTEELQSASGDTAALVIERMLEIGIGRSLGIQSRFRERCRDRVAARRFAVERHANRGRGTMGDQNPRCVG